MVFQDIRMSLRNKIPASYIIHKEGNMIKARKAETGQVVYKNADFGTVINFAISNLPAEGGEVYLPKGTYTISSPILLRGGVKLRGSGMQSTIIKCVAGYTGNFIEWKPTENEYFASMEELQINGGVAGATGNGLYCDKSLGGSTNDFQFFHVFFLNLPECGIRTKSSWGWKILDCLAEYCGDAGFKIQSAHQVVIKGCFIAYNGGTYGLELSAAGEIAQIVGNTVYKNKTHGIGSSADYTQIVGNCVFENGQDNLGHGILLMASSDYSTVTGNTIIAGTSPHPWRGIKIESDHNSVSGNSLDDAWPTVIEDAGTDNDVSHNVGY